MIWIIARKEFTETVRDGRFLLTGFVVFFLFISAIGVGAIRYTEDQAMRQDATAEERELWLNQGKKGPHAAGHYGVYAFKPATPLAFFDPGYNDYTGTLQYLEAHRENQASFKPATDGTALQRFGDLSGAMVLQLLIPLLIFLLCFGMVTGEREDGTLRQLMSIGVARSKLIWGKAAGAGLALSAVVLPCVLIGAVLAAVFIKVDDPHLMIGFPTKLVVITLVYVVFFITLTAIALSVSIRAKSSAAALTTLLAFWIVTALLVPRIASDLSKVIYDLPSSFELAEAVQKGRAEGPHAHSPNHPNHKAFKKKMLEKYNVERVEDLPFSFLGLALEEDEKVGYEVFDRTYGHVRRTFVKQNQLHEIFGLLSPFIAVKTLSNAIAGTDVYHSNDFSKSAEAYRRQMVTILNEDIKKKAVGMSKYESTWGYKANKSLWEQIPPFDYDPPPLATVLGHNKLPIFILIIWLVGSLALLSYSARRVKTVNQ